DFVPVPGAVIGHFSPEIAYVFRIRAGRTAGTGPELRIVCTFVGDDATQQGTCAPFVFDDRGVLHDLPNNEANDFSLETVTEKPSGLGMKVFGGVRSDSFFTDTLGVIEYTHRKVVSVFEERQRDGRLKNLLKFVNVM